MICEVTGVDILADKTHTSYKPKGEHWASSQVGQACPS
jgi:hypothetical protein